jgi:hypothetical protein
VVPVLDDDVVHVRGAEAGEVARDGDEVGAAVALVELHPTDPPHPPSASTDRTTSFVGVYTSAFRLAAAGCSSCITPLRNTQTPAPEPDMMMTTTTPLATLAASAF